MEIVEYSYEWSYPLTPRRKYGLVFLCREGVSGFSAQDAHYCRRMCGDAGIAYHYYVREDGTVERGRPERCSAGLGEDFDAECVAVCFEGGRGGLAPAQLEAGLELIRDIVSRFPGIALRQDGLSEAIYAFTETLN